MAVPAESTAWHLTHIEWQRPELSPPQCSVVTAVNIHSVAPQLCVTLFSRALTSALDVAVEQRTRGRLLWCVLTSALCWRTE